MNKVIIDSLRRLYHNDTLTEEQYVEVELTVEKLIQTKKITNEEYDYITGKDGN